MIKNSKVTSITPNGTWEGNYGLTYKFEIEMENGDVGEYLSKYKDQTKFVVDQTVDYEFKDGQYPKIKPINNFQNNNTMNKDKVQEYIVRQSSLDRAVTLCVAQGIYGKEDIIARAEYFADWVLGKDLSSLPFVDKKAPF